MTISTAVVLIALTVAAAFMAWVLWRTVWRLRELEAAKGQPDQALLLLQGEIQASRGEARQIQTETLSVVRQELHQFRTEITGQMGNMGTGVQDQLRHVSQVVGTVQGGLGRLGEATQRVFDVAKDIAGLEQILKSPKVRGGLGETFLENLLAQMLPRDHYTLQHEFSTGDRVDAVVKIGDRLVPVDAKFPLENFRRMLEEPEEEKRRQLRRAFVRDVRARADEIAKKYILPDEGTFDFALMYIPAENVYYEIIVKDEAIEEESVAAYAIGRRVIPVSPNSFYAYLRVIVLGLRGLQIERDAREIQARLIRLRGDFEKFREAFEVLGKHLTHARSKYEDAVSALNRVEAKLEGVEGKDPQPALPGTV
ncbi:MAG: DNA recombination protein RmuC [Candidatus Methylomirabilales bacterium]